MTQENDIKQMVQQVLAEMLAKEENNDSAPAPAASANGKTTYENGVIEDITGPSLQEQFFFADPLDREGYMEMKKYTPARLGVSHAGPRYNTISMLRFRADHATAQDSVFSDVSEECIKENGFISGQSRCIDRDQYVTRPDLGRLLNDETREMFKKNLKPGVKVQIMVGDGLSSDAIGANIADIIPAITQGLKSQGVEVGPIPFVKFCRVGAMDDVGELTGAEVVCLLIGERPGLVTSESMSAYIAYKPTINMPESRRTVVSNIHKGGTPAVEAGAHIAGLLKLILDKKTSGVDLNL